MGAWQDPSTPAECLPNLEPVRHLLMPVERKGYDLVWPRPCLATTKPTGHGLSNFGDNLKLADLGRFFVGWNRFGLPWPIWAMALRILGGQPDFGLAKPIWAMALRIFGGQPDFGRARPPSAGPPKIFFSFSRPHFHSFFSLSGDLLVSFFSLRMSSRVFFPLSGGLLVEFWWCFGQSGPQMCLFSPSGCRVEAPGSLKAKTSTFEVPTDQNTTKIPREDPQREGKRHEKTSGERKKRREDPQREKK